MLSNRPMAVIFVLLLLFAWPAEGLPPFYRVVPPGRGTCSYLLGTMHDFPFERFPARLVQMAKDARVVLIENVRVPLTKRERLLAVIPESAHVFSEGELESKLPAESFRALKSHMETCFREGEWEHLHPWMIALLYFVLLRPNEALDHQIAAQCRPGRVIGLETLSDQRNSFSQALLVAPSPEEMLPLLEGVASINREEYERRISFSLSMYLLGGFDMPCPSDTARQREDKILLGDRNAAWWGAIRSATLRGNAFVAVGAAHLREEESGLIGILKNERYSVERLAFEWDLPSRPSLLRRLFRGR
jgi:uncharacterized protein YbaP (TraB family)